ncbi:ring-1,2-phenylacetyl-CoA epoxidase subunit PaaD [Pseudarthrobacter enclensis]|uniref:1,2-phenylacetyl-CoA epoxidase subunit PaaD n=1 Tax=Pseudarthrobacter enclensis TaxID=993070 RepID=UPI0008162B07|nr:1,2-phenylacetyl-CoA epoxidase subunit PaaD [Pseudarthrobacter enclensis]SCC30026.1 ring-1,2-phenylacetyl-CoA epoxidase subunit PaaD [Pseudarthrobacter enclensis]
MVNLEDIRTAAASVPDPEIPVLTIEDLGVLRDVAWDDAGGVVVVITPTYSGCPAMAEISNDIKSTLGHIGVHDVRVETVLAPAWSTDWISDEGRTKLSTYGIAPPAPTRRDGPVPLTLVSVRCPQCNSSDTKLITAFGSTACKALRKCRSCEEVFDHVKPY